MPEPETQKELQKETQTQIFPENPPETTPKKTLPITLETPLENSPPEPIIKQIIKQVTKRDGRLVNFDINKITSTITKAIQFVEEGNEALAEKLSQLVLDIITEEKSETVNVSSIQDAVERVFIEESLAKSAKAYILFRHKKDEDRERRALILGEHHPDENILFSNEALSILGKRYLLKDVEDNLLETPRQMLWRVANNVAEADGYYGAALTDIHNTAKEFYAIMAALQFLPNSPTLMNAGTKSQQLSSCFVLPIEDSMESIFGTLRDAAIVHQRGSGTGFSFSRLRPKNDQVKNSFGVAAGPVAFLGVYDSAMEIVKQGGVRPGANMAVLRVDHPDILRFIEAKREKKALRNFNISVAVTDNFMRAVEEDREYFLWNPRTDKYCGKLRARDVFAVITQNAWKTGDPGLIFIDEINRKHPAKNLGEIETTNQCGEAPLLPYEGCALGSLNILKFINEEKTDLNWDLLREAIRTSVHFLDNVIDQNKYPSQEIETATKRSRKFGLGIMGLADSLFTIKIKYDSEEGLEFANKLMSFIKETSYEKSSELAAERGPCPAWEGSEHDKSQRKMRNMACNSISPTGTISILANVSSGCEPLYALSYQRTLLTSNELIYLNPIFEQVAKEREIYVPELMRKVSKVGSIQNFKEIPKDLRDLFVTAQDISPEWHIKMQATLQKYIDNSISKTINFPNTASIRDIEEAYLLAWKSKCKGITIYRDGSYEDQVLSMGDGS